MQVMIEMTDETREKIMVEELKDGFKINLQFPDEPEYDAINQAYLVLLQHYSTEKDFKEFMKTFSKDRQKYNAKRLADAYGGL
jgi:hypothetical protein